MNPVAGLPQPAATGARPRGAMLSALLAWIRKVGYRPERHYMRGGRR